MTRFVFAAAALAAFLVAALAGCGGSTAPCGPANCGGCCLSNVCYTGTQNTACGLGGDACLSCGSPEVCLSNGACGLDALQLWQVQPSTAQITSTDNGSLWDGDGSPPDVFVTIGCPGSPDTSGQTPTVESYTPAWSSGGCYATTQDLLNRGFSVQLWDQDAVVDDTITAALPVTGLQEGHFVAGYADLPASGGMLTLRVLLIPQ